MFLQPMFEIFDDAISSAGSADGSLPCSLPDGPKNGQHGQAHAPVNRSRQRASAKERKTSGTCGPSSSGSSKSAGRRSSSGSKSHPQKLSERALKLLSLPRFKGVISPQPIAPLTSSLKRVLSDVNPDGSMEYLLTWKESVTPAGRPICRLLASGRRKSASDCSGAPSDLNGWPTPDVHHHGTAADPLAKTRPSGSKRQMVLQDAVRLTCDSSAMGSSTPESTSTAPKSLAGSTDHEGSGSRSDGRAKLQGQAKMAGWATPQARSEGAGNSDYDRLIETAMGLRPSKNEPLGAITESSPASTERRAGSVLNAAMSRWLMGYPAKWDEASPNYQDWCAAQERIASGDYEGTGTQS